MELGMAPGGAVHPHPGPLPAPVLRPVLRIGDPGELLSGEEADLDELHPVFDRPLSCGNGPGQVHDQAAGLRVLSHSRSTAAPAGPTYRQQLEVARCAPCRCPWLHSASLIRSLASFICKTQEHETVPHPRDTGVATVGVALPRLLVSPSLLVAKHLSGRRGCARPARNSSVAAVCRASWTLASRTPACRRIAFQARQSSVRSIEPPCCVAKTRS